MKVTPHQQLILNQDKQNATKVVFVKVLIVNVLTVTNAQDVYKLKVLKWLEKTSVNA